MDSVRWTRDLKSIMSTMYHVDYNAATSAPHKGFPITITQSTITSRKELMRLGAELNQSTVSK